MKSTSSALLEHQRGEVTTTCGCWKVVRSDGTTLAFTEHDQPVTVSALVYEAKSGFRRTNIKSTEDLAVDNLDLDGLLQSSAITEGDIRAGRYDGAEVWFFETNYKDPAAGIDKLSYGVVGNVTVRDGVFVAELRSLAQKLQQGIGRHYQKKCDAVLGDSHCGVVLQPSGWTASTAYASGGRVSPGVYSGYFHVVASVTASGLSGGAEPTWTTSATTDNQLLWQAYEAWTKQGAVSTVAAGARRVFADGARAEASGWFDGGVLTWTAGLNTGLAMEVKSYASGGQIELFQSMPYAIASSDTFTISAGCNHLLRLPSDGETERNGDCAVKFDNVVNHQGFPDLPGEDLLIGGR